jgi:hypothetical protein
MSVAASTLCSPSLVPIHGLSSTRSLAGPLPCTPAQLALHEVFHGGLGSWSLTNMVLAHLMEDTRAHSGHGGGTADDAARGAARARHAGLALLSFLRRFGGQGFDYGRDAVSVRLGGCVRREQLQGFSNPNTFLALEDPLTGERRGLRRARWTPVAGSELGACCACALPLGRMLPPCRQQPDVTALRWRCACPHTITCLSLLPQRSTDPPVPLALINPPRPRGRRRLPPHGGRRGSLWTRGCAARGRPAAHCQARTAEEGAHTGAAAAAGGRPGAGAHDGSAICRGGGGRGGGQRSGGAGCSRRRRR